MSDNPRKSYYPAEVIKQLNAQLDHAASLKDISVSVTNPATAEQLRAFTHFLPVARPSTPVTTPADLGRMVRQAREAMNLTQAEFADLAGVGRRFVSELENGKATLELGKVMTACAAAGLSLLVGPR